MFDGGRKFLRLRWSDGTQYELDTRQPIELPARLVGVPARVTDSPESPAALVADASGAVHLIRGDAPRIERTWRLAWRVEEDAR